MSHAKDPMKRWKNIAEQLLAYRDQQREEWGGLDDVAVTRYLSDPHAEDVKAAVEAAIREKPAVEELVETVRGVVQQFEEERLADRRDGEALRTFLDRPPSDFCRAVAESHGDLLIAYLQPAPKPPTLAGWPYDAWTAHVAGCAYCRRMNRRMSGLLHSEQLGVAAGSKLLRDWMLEDDYRRELDEITRRLQPRGESALNQALERATALAAPVTHDLLAVDGALVEQLKASLHPPADQIPRVVRDVVVMQDRLLALAAGEADAILMTSPLWFTWLLTPPPSLSWAPRPEDRRWHVRLWDPRGDDLLDADVTVPAVHLPEAVREAIPTDTDLRWEVVGFSESDAPEEGHRLARAVFRVMNPTDGAAAKTRLEQLDLRSGGLVGEMALASCCFENRLFEDLVRHLDCLKERYSSGPLGFLVRRALASSFGEIRRELTGRRRLGSPEGLWATTLVDENLRSAYGAIGINY